MSDATNLPGHLIHFSVVSNGEKRIVGRQETLHWRDSPLLRERVAWHAALERWDLEDREAACTSATTSA